MALGSLRGRRAAIVALVVLALIGVGAPGASANPPTDTWPAGGNASRELVLGPDGRVWFTDDLQCHIGAVDTEGQVTTYTALPPETDVCSADGPLGIAPSADGTLWFTNVQPPKIGTITTAGTLRWIDLPVDVTPRWITQGPDGVMWFAGSRRITNGSSPILGRVADSGDVTLQPVLPERPGAFTGITSTPTALWWTFQKSERTDDTNPNVVGRTVPDGATTTFELPDGATPRTLLAGPAGNVFVGRSDAVVSRFTSAGTQSDVAVAGPVVDLTQGPDELVWLSFEEDGGNGIQQLDATGHPARTARWVWTHGDAQSSPTPRLLSAGSDGRVWFVSPWGHLGAVKIDRPFADVSLTVDPPRQRAFAPVTLTAAVTAPGDGTGIPNGEVTFFQYFEDPFGHGPPSTVELGSAPVDTDGTATLTVELSDRQTGDEEIRASYTGDATFAGSASPPATVDIYYDDVRTYITQVYEDLLARQPEKAGLEYWVGQLGSGAPRTAVAHALAISSEHDERIVERLFQDYLRRTPERAGRDAFVADLLAGATINQVRASIIGSQEYFDRIGGGTIDGFIDAAYDDVLGRAPETAGRNYWRNQLTSGVSKPTMASALVHSREAFEDLVTSDYQRFLRRAVEPCPPSSGCVQTHALEYWTDLLVQGFPEQRFIAELIGSDEYYGAAVSGHY